MDDVHADSELFADEDTGQVGYHKVAVFGRALQKLNIPCRKSGKGTLYHLLKIE